MLETSWINHETTKKAANEREWTIILIVKFGYFLECGSLLSLLPLLGGFDLQSSTLLPLTINAGLGRDSDRGHQQAGASQSGSKLSKLPHSKGRESMSRLVTRKGHETQDCARRNLDSVLLWYAGRGEGIFQRTCE